MQILNYQGKLQHQCTKVQTKTGRSQKEKILLQMMPNKKIVKSSWWMYPVSFKLFISWNTQSKWCPVTARSLSWKDFTSMARCFSPHIHLLHFVQWPAWTIGQADKLPSTTASLFSSRSQFLYCEFPSICIPTPTIFVAEDLSCNLHFEENIFVILMMLLLCANRKSGLFVSVHLNHYIIRDIISTIPLW